MSEAPSLHRGVRAFAPRTVAILLAVGVASFLGLAVLAAYAPELRDGRDGGAHALSSSAVGFAGVAELARGMHAPVVISRGPLPAPTGPAGLMILTPPPFASKKDIAKLHGIRPILIVLPKWITGPAPLHPGWVVQYGAWPEASAVGMLQPGVGALTRHDVTTPATLAVTADMFGRPQTFVTGPVEALQTLPATPEGVLMTDAAGRAVLVRIAPDVFVLTDPDLLNNRAMADAKTARTAWAILDALRDHAGPVVFDVTLSGFARDRSLLRLALAPPFVGATLCGLAAALMMGAHAAARFGPTRRAERDFALGKRALVDNAAVLIRLAKREAKMGARYAALSRGLGARAAAVRREATPQQADAALDKLTPEGAAPFSALALAAERAADPHALVAAARDLHQRRLEITRERV